MKNFTASIFYKGILLLLIISLISTGCKKGIQDQQAPVAGNNENSPKIEKFKELEGIFSISKQ